MSDIFERNRAFEHDDVCRVEWICGVSRWILVDSTALNQFVETLLVDNLFFYLFQHMSELALGIVKVHLSPQAEVLECKAIVNAGSESLVRDRSREIFAVVAHHQDLPFSAV